MPQGSAASGQAARLATLGDPTMLGATSMAEVILTNVDKVYEGAAKVVNNFNLHIRDGEFIVLVGPSGCGKSTTLRMIAGLEDITSGTIQIGERIVNDVSPKDRDIAMVFQSYALYPHMTVFENMAFALQLRKVPKLVIEQKVRRAADILGIVPLLARKPKALSGGQRQRVAVGRAIVREPQCFLFDEPLSNLDAKLRMEMRTEIRELHDSLESTTVYVTHDQEEAMTLGDRVVVMKEGVAQQVGSAYDIYNAPANRFVAGFLGSPSMNFLQGQLVKQGEQLYFDEGTGKLRVPAASARQLESQLAKDVVLGVRPESLSDEKSASFETGGNSLIMKVRQVQMLGNCLHVYLGTEKHKQLVAAVDASAPFKAKETAVVYVDMSRALFFSAAGDGVRLTGPGV
jgi:multiple sugar transport system ATP-binding protein